MAEYIIAFPEEVEHELFFDNLKKSRLVRCRDCRYFGNKVRVGDTFVCNKHGIYVPKDGFCSEGKAK